MASQLVPSRRWRVIALGVLLAIIGAVVPVVAMSWVSYHLANRQELAILKLFADRAIFRATTTLQEARKTMEAMERADLNPCSNEHIALMRNQTINTPSVEEIGYFENGYLKCSSWGVTEQAIPMRHADFTTPDGLAVTLRMKPSVSFVGEMTAVSMGKYNALIAPSRFVDIVIDSDMTLALLNDRGQVINVRNNPDSVVVASVSKSGQSGVYASYLASVARNGSLTAVVTEPRSKLISLLWKELIVFLPVGALISFLLVGAIYWLSKRRLSPQAELDLAVRKHEFILHYQPIVDLQTGVCIGAEALVRWKRPDGSLVQPDLFIPLAEETGLIALITDQVIDALIADLSAVLVGDRSLHIAINVCSEDVQSGRIVDLIDDKLRATGIRKEQIWLEATERGFLDVDSASRTLDRARKAGHSVAIDDFGTGYSSLQYLQRLPLDALKIDKSFVEAIEKETATSSVILHIIELAQELGLFSVAEGVETEEQAAFLRRHGVNFAQGWLFSKPLSSAAFIHYLADRKHNYGIAPEVIRIHRLKDVRAPVTSQSSETGDVDV